MAEYIDTRDLAKRLDEFNSTLSIIDEIKLDISLSDDPDEIKDLEYELNNIKEESLEDKDEYDELELLSREIPEWEDGNTLIPVDEWVEYVKEMLEDCGEIPSDISWYIAINWEETADNISSDYSTIDYNGNEYYFRNY